MALTWIEERAKRAMDVAGACVGLAVSAPLMAGAAVAIRTTMGSPVLFRQARPGHHGRPFELMKFRTMAVAKAGEGIESDGARLTRLGSLLRKLSIDELPTFINVLKGDMSLVGPRPLLMAYLPRYSARQSRRHEVKPGVTGWAQVNGRNALSWEEKFELDVWYVDHQSIGLDLLILWKTVAKVLRSEDINSANAATMTEFLGTPRLEAVG